MRNVVTLRPGSWINWDREINDGDDFWDKIDNLEGIRMQEIKEAEWAKEYDHQRMRHLDKHRLTDAQVAEGVRTEPFYETIMSVTRNKKWRSVAAQLACKTA